MISKKELNLYLLNGHITPNWKLSSKQISDLIKNVEKLISDNKHCRPEQIVCPHMKGGTMGDLKGDTYNYFIKLAYTKEIIQLLTPILGQNIILWGSQVFCKPPKDGMAVPMHQDSHYWPIKPMSTCSVWIAIDKSSKINGCLKVISKSHKENFIHGKSQTGTALNSGIPLKILKDKKIDYIILEPGQLSLHDATLIHGSDANHSTFRRAGIVFRYMNSNSLFDRKHENHHQKDGHEVNYSKRPIWLIKGHSGKNTLVKNIN